MRNVRTLSRGSYEDQNLRLLILFFGLLSVLQMLAGCGGGSAADPPEPRLSVAPNQQSRQSGSRRPNLWVTVLK